MLEKWRSLHNVMRSLYIFYIGPETYGISVKKSNLDSERKFFCAFLEKIVYGLTDEKKLV
jgi:hypothetical protein